VARKSDHRAVDANTPESFPMAETTDHPLRLNCYVILHLPSEPPYPDPAKTPQIAAAVAMVDWL
jgi:hypothetical protein